MVDETEADSGEYDLAAPRGERAQADDRNIDNEQHGKCQRQADEFEGPCYVGGNSACNHLAVEYTHQLQQGYQHKQADPLTDADEKHQKQYPKRLEAPVRDKRLEESAGADGPRR